MHAEQQDVIADPIAWSMPERTIDINDRWLDSFISTRLVDVVARRYFNRPFTQLAMQDRVAVRSTVETWVSELTEEFGR